MTGDAITSQFLRRLQRSTRNQEILQSVAAPSGILVVAISTLVLVGWALDIPQLKSLVEGWATMKPNTAVAFMSLGLALCFGSHDERKPHNPHVRKVFAAFVVLVGTLTLTEYFFGWDLGIDQIVFTDLSGGAGLSPAGRMAPATAIGFVLMGTALALLDTTRHYWLVQCAALSATFVGFVAIIGYFYGVSSLHKFGPFVSVALHTAMLFVLVGAAVLCLRPSKGLMSIVTSESAGGTAARRLLPVAIVAPLVLAWVQLTGQQAGLYDSTFGLAILASSCVVILTSVILWSSASIHKTDLQRQRAKAGFSQVVESTPSAIVMADQAGRIVLVNEQTENVFGYPRHELLGQAVEILVPAHFRDRHPGHRAEFFAAPEARPMGIGRDLYGQRRDGSLFPVEIGLTPIVTEEGSFVLSAIVDITERRLAEERERRRLAELAHAGRLSMLGEMVSGLAHEINQPLAAARNYARASVNFAQSNEHVSIEQLVELMNNAAVQADRASEIVERLNSFVKKGLPACVPIDVNQVVRDVLALTVPSFWPGQIRADRIELRTTLDESLPKIAADRVQIEQVLLNLTRNAVEAMKECNSEDCVLEIQTLKIGNLIKIMVSDRGKGVVPENLSRLFEPFFTTKPDGVGLGLSISRSIIEAHSGRLWAEPNNGRGICFAFTLPIPEGSST